MCLCDCLASCKPKKLGKESKEIDIDFKNAAGFIGVDAGTMEAQYIVYFLSHAMMFCTGSLIEAHVVLTTASCIYGEKYKFDVYAGTHKFLEQAGVGRTVDHMGIHRGYNHTGSCSPDNIALLVLGEQFFFNKREPATEYIPSRMRYGTAGKQSQKNLVIDQDCRFYGWGSRRNGYLVPLLLYLRRVDVVILPPENCQKMWNYAGRFLCVQQYPCKTAKHGALCPDDLGAALECSGFLRGLMTTRVIDRPCGVGFLDTAQYIKFLTCGVDDSRDIVGHNDFMEFEFDYTTIRHPTLPQVKDVSPLRNKTKLQAAADPGPPKEKSTEPGDEAETDATLGVPTTHKKHHSNLPSKLSNAELPKETSPTENLIQENLPQENPREVNLPAENIPAQNPVQQHPRDQHRDGTM